ncbi:hypothetical protein VTO73DRAFT_9528 [Trametes versicolor]
MQIRPCHNIHTHLLSSSGDRQDASNHVAELAGALAYQVYAGPVRTEAKRDLWDLPGPRELRVMRPRRSARAVLDLAASLISSACGQCRTLARSKSPGRAMTTVWPALARRSDANTIVCCCCNTQVGSWADSVCSGRDRSQAVRSGTTTCSGRFYPGTDAVRDVSSPHGAASCPGSSSTYHEIPLNMIIGTSLAEANMITSRHVDNTRDHAQRDPTRTPSEYGWPLEKLECDGAVKTRSLSRAVAPEPDLSGPTRQAAGSARVPP